MNNISFEINNHGQLFLEQSKHDDTVIIKKIYPNSSNCNEVSYIYSGDMIMLLNYYRYIKDNDIQCDFINPDGKNKRY